MKRTFFYSLLIVGLMTLVNLVLAPVIGYRAIGMIYLMLLQTATLVYKDFNIVFSSVVTAILWNYLFIPPRFTFGIQDEADWFLVICYIFTSLVIGYFSKKIKQHQKELNEQKLVEESERIYKTLLNSVSHEVKTPIAAIRGFVQYYLQGTFENKTQAADEVIKEINIAALRLEEVVQNLLDMGRLESGNLKLHREISDIPEILYSAHNKVKDKIDNRKFTFNFAQDLPMIKIDIFLVEQAFENIYRNACLYTPDLTEIISEVKIFNHQFVITISDTGNGLGPDPQNVFNKFYRSMPKIAGGTGLGLSIAKAIVELHSGKIKAENLPVRGACFTITLPFDPPFHHLELNK